MPRTGILYKTVLKTRGEWWNIIPNTQAEWSNVKEYWDDLLLEYDYHKMLGTELSNLSLTRYIELQRIRAELVLKLNKNGKDFDYWKNEKPVIFSN